MSRQTYDKTWLYEAMISNSCYIPRPPVDEIGKVRLLFRDPAPVPCSYCKRLKALPEFTCLGCGAAT